jgi:hypothetical protein
MNTTTNADTIGPMDIDSRIDAYPWPNISKHLDAHGWAIIKRLLTASECAAVVCSRSGVGRVWPAVWQYGEGDFNPLHQDLYGEHVFPLQVAILLSEPEQDFTGGEFVLVEQRPRMQSRAEVVPLRRGDGVVFAVRNRPVQGTHGTYRVTLRHGVSRLRSGRRHTVGVIFHDAK